MAKMDLSPFDRGRQIATAKAAGITQLATDAQAIAASRADRAVSASNLAALTAANLTAMKASDAEAQAKASSSVFLTPSNLAADGFLQEATVSLTNAQVKALATTPIELVPAPGAGKVNMLRLAYLRLNYGGNNAFTEAGDNMQINFTDGSGVRVSSTIEATGFIDQTADTYTQTVPLGNAIVAATGAENQALVLFNAGSNYAGNAANDNTLDVHVLYNVLEL